MLIGPQEEGEWDLSKNQIVVNWDVYEELGCPQITSVDDLIPLMKQMMEARPTAADGTKTWGTILNSGSDTTHWGNMQQYYKWFGYEPDNLPYLIESDMINGEYYNLLEQDRDSLYYQGLKWYNTAYREGVMDPDSINNEREAQKAKVEKSLACMVPSGTLQGYASNYMPIYLPRQVLYQEHWASTYGKDNYMVINANTEHLDACLKLLDAFSDMDFYFEIWNGSEEEGLWEYGEDGLVYPTEYGLQSNVDTIMGKADGVKFTNGEKVQLWNDYFIPKRDFSDSYMGPNGVRQARGMSTWDEVKEETEALDENKKEWKETYGYENFVELLKDKDAYVLDSKLTDVVNFCPMPDDTMQLTVDAIKDTMVEGSWQMVYAEDDASFEAIWDQMMQDCKDLGAEEIVQWRMEELNKGIEIKNALKAE